MSSNQTVSARVSSGTPRVVRRTAKGLLLSASLGFALLLGIGAAPAVAAPTLPMNGTGGPPVLAPTLQYDNVADSTMVLGAMQPDNGTGGPPVI